MTLDTFFEKFDLYADAPDAVAKMRELVLELAVQGRLVAQDPADEPAATQLARIAAVKARLKPTGRTKKETERQKAGTDEGPNRPTGWAETVLADLVTIWNGRAYAKEELLAQGTPVLRVGNLFTNNHWYYSDLELEPEKYCDKGDLIFAWSASFGPFIWQGPKVIYHYHIWKLDLHSAEDLNRRFLYWFLYNKTQEIKRSGHGVSMLHMTKEKMEKLPVMLPPLAEQKRIVAKVDELMALCDRLEAQQQEREAKASQLARASLARFADAPTPANLDYLFHSSFNIPPSDLRKSILTLAVQGKLVPQDPNDEPADVFLGQIAERLGKPKGKRSSNNGAATVDEGKPFDLPPGWAWSRFPDLGEFGRGKSKHRPRNDPSLFVGGTHRLVQTGDVARANGTIQTHTGLYNDAGLSQSKKWPAGTLCITIAANIADSGILGFDACFPDSVVGFIPAKPIPSVHYFEFFMRTAKEHLEQFAPSTAQKNINLGILEQVWIPIPPLAEQRRIVAKVEQLMAWVDALETQLAASRTTAANLLSALVAELTAHRPS